MNSDGDRFVSWPKPIRLRIDRLAIVAHWEASISPLYQCGNCDQFKRVLRHRSDVCLQVAELTQTHAGSRCRAGQNEPDCQRAIEKTRQ